MISTSLLISLLALVAIASSGQADSTHVHSRSVHGHKLNGRKWNHRRYASNEEIHTGKSVGARLAGRYLNRKDDDEYIRIGDNGSNPPRPIPAVYYGPAVVRPATTYIDDDEIFGGGGYSSTGPTNPGGYSSHWDDDEFPGYAALGPLSLSGLTNRDDDEVFSPRGGWNSPTFPTNPGSSRWDDDEFPVALIPAGYRAYKSFSRGNDDDERLRQLDSQIGGVGGVYGGGIGGWDGHNVPTHPRNSYGPNRWDDDEFPVGLIAPIAYKAFNRKDDDEYLRNRDREIAGGGPPDQFFKRYNYDDEVDDDEVDEEFFVGTPFIRRPSESRPNKPSPRPLFLY